MIEVVESNEGRGVELGLVERVMVVAVMVQVIVKVVQVEIVWGWHCGVADKATACHTGWHPI